MLSRADVMAIAEGRKPNPDGDAPTWNDWKSSILRLDTNPGQSVSQSTFTFFLYFIFKK